MTLAVAIGAVTTGASVVRLTGREPATHHAAERVLGPTAPDERIDFSLVLRLPGRDRLERFLSETQDPDSPRFGDRVAASEFGRRFGLTDEELARLERVLEGAGLTVTGSYPQRTAINVAGLAAAVEDLFQVELQDRVNARGVHFHAPSVGATVPGSISSHVDTVAGLDNEPPPPHTTADIPSTDGLRPQDLATAYNIEPLHDAGIEGEGITVAIFTLFTFNAADVHAFDERYGIEDAPDVEIVPVNGGTDETHAEDALDIQTVRAVAPQAQIINYEVSPQATSFGEIVADGIDEIVADGDSDIISISYGVSDTLPYLPLEDRARGEQALKAAAAQGINIFVASGDDGAFDCEAFDVTDHRICTSWPGDSSSVISVGGTLVAMREDGTILRELGWQDELSRGGSGGGHNPFDKAPAYQKGPGVDNEFSTGFRQLPDVAGPADPDSGYAVIYEGEVSAVGGTSGSTPFWAGITALIEDRADDEGVESIGLLNPLLYRLGQSDDPPYNDVVLGGNRFHPATPGWDYATGWGSPNVAELVEDVVAFLTNGS